MAKTNTEAVVVMANQRHYVGGLLQADGLCTSVTSACLTTRWLDVNNGAEKLELCISCVKMFRGCPDDRR